jgi:DNA repair protein RecO (recombination protein O)
MLYKTEGIVLNFIKYKESSVIVKIYTELFGFQSYIVNGVRSKSSKNRIALLQPLTVLDLIVYHKSQNGINRISDLKCAAPFKSIPFDVKKSSIALFITEILIKTLKEPQPNTDLFQYLKRTVITFDELQTGYENLHLHFLFDFSRFLGFLPSNFEDLAEASSGLATFSKEESESIYEVFFCTNDKIKILNKTRRLLLDYLLQFYKVHVENFGEVKSIKILRELM